MHHFFFVFFVTLDTGPGRPLSLELSDTKSLGASGDFIEKEIQFKTLMQ